MSRRYFHALILLFLVLRVFDGDTIQVDYHGRVESVRLLNVDTPERNQPGYETATDFTKKHLLGQDVDLEFDTLQPPRDRFGRLLCYVWIDGQMFNLMLIEAGHSKYYTKYGKSGTYHNIFISSSKDVDHAKDL